MNYIILIGIALFFILTAIRNGDAGWDFRTNAINFRVSDGDYSLRVKGDGNVDLEPDGSGLASLDRGGSFDVSLRRNGVDRRVLYTRDDATIERKFFVNGDEQAWGPEADRFVADVMPILLRETAINAGERVAWLIDNRGQDGLLDEIELIRSDFAQRVYSVQYAKTATIAPADFERLMKMTGDNMSSDFDVRTTLIEAFDAQMPTGTSFDALLRAGETISSDFDMRLALQPLLTSSDSNDDVVARALDLAGNDISSDFDLRTVLSAASGRVGQSDTLARAYTTASRSISSDSDQRLALTSLGEDAELTPAGWQMLLEAASDISSDWDAATLLTELVPHLPRDEAVLRAYRATLDTIGSDFDRQRAAGALEDARR